MKDRFKFRHWDKRINKMFYPERNDNFGYYVNNSDIIETMQCTGLKDKNSKLIYEGDILKGKKNMICSPHFSSIMIDKVGVVEISQNMFVATCRDVKNNCILFCQNDWVKTEVIGNIYENKELLNEQYV